MLTKLANLVKFGKPSQTELRKKLKEDRKFRDEIKYLAKSLLGADVTNCPDCLIEFYIQLYYIAQKKEKKDMEYKLKAGAVLKEAGNLAMNTSQHNLTEERALYHLALNYNRNIRYFSALPQDIKKRLDAYKETGEAPEPIQQIAEPAKSKVQDMPNNLGEVIDRIEAKLDKIISFFGVDIEYKPVQESAKVNEDEKGTEQISEGAEEPATSFADDLNKALAEDTRKSEQELEEEDLINEIKELLAEKVTSEAIHEAYKDVKKIGGKNLTKKLLNEFINKAKEA